MAPWKGQASLTQGNDLKKTRCPPQGSRECVVCAGLFTSCQSCHVTAPGPGASCSGAAPWQHTSMPICRALPLAHCPGHGHGNRTGRDFCLHPLPLGEPWGWSPKSVSCPGCLITTGEGGRKGKGEGTRGVPLGAQTHAWRGCGGRQGEGEVGAVLSGPLDSPSKRGRGSP